MVRRPVRCHERPSRLQDQRSTASHICTAHLHRTFAPHICTAPLRAHARAGRASPAEQANVRGWPRDAHALCCCKLLLLWLCRRCCCTLLLLWLCRCCCCVPRLLVLLVLLVLELLRHATGSARTDKASLAKLVLRGCGVASLGCGCGVVLPGCGAPGRCRGAMTFRSTSGCGAALFSQARLFGERSLLAASSYGACMMTNLVVP